MNLPCRAAFRVANALLFGDDNDDIPPPANLFVDNENDNDDHDVGDDVESKLSGDIIIDVDDLVELDPDESDSDNDDQHLSGMISPSGLLWFQNPPIAAGRQP